MGVRSSTLEWEPPPEPAQMSDAGSNVDYYLVGSQVVLEHSSESLCRPKVNVTMECDELYAMLGEQYSKRYRMLYFGRAPGDISCHYFSQGLRVIFQGYFRMNPNLGERYGDPISWQLRVDRSWFQTLVNFGGAFTLETKRVVNTNTLVDCIARNTQNGERLVCATVTGHCRTQTTRQLTCGYSPHNAVDMFFEVPCPVPSESYMYNIALVPVRIEFSGPFVIFFPKIACDWMATFNSHLSQGWRLIDIYIDYPMVEQLLGTTLAKFPLKTAKIKETPHRLNSVTDPGAASVSSDMTGEPPLIAKTGSLTPGKKMRTPPKLRRRLCGAIETNALWIFEKPKSKAEDSSPLYEGTMVEQLVPLKAVKAGLGIQSTHDWMPVIRDMGSRGWELACVVECHSVLQPSFGKVILKSLLFFQRPLDGCSGQADKTTTTEG
ncbi:hypothetical protein V1264_003750 [Littorina saxatilis]|uniref:Uncharacterized protein n=1 Tax=Littorina saxatilis TaxID=31220 RepID=A0AAN9B0P1_9CAEN